MINKRGNYHYHIILRGYYMSLLYHHVFVFYDRETRLIQNQFGKYMQFMQHANNGHAVHNVTQWCQIQTAQTTHCH